MRAEEQEEREQVVEKEPDMEARVCESEASERQPKSEEEDIQNHIEGQNEEQSNESF